MSLKTVSFFIALISTIPACDNQSNVTEGQGQGQGDHESFKSLQEYDCNDEDDYVWVGITEDEVKVVDFYSTNTVALEQKMILHKFLPGGLPGTEHLNGNFLGIGSPQTLFHVPAGSSLSLNIEKDNRRGVPVSEDGTRLGLKIQYRIDGTNTFIPLEAYNDRLRVNEIDFELDQNNLNVSFSGFPQCREEKEKISATSGVIPFEFSIDTAPDFDLSEVDYFVEVTPIMIGTKEMDLQEEAVARNYILHATIE